MLPWPRLSVAVVCLAGVVCALDECSAACGTCAHRNCTDAGQVCEDPDRRGLGNWLCRCPPGTTGVAVGGAATCVPAEGDHAKRFVHPLPHIDVIEILGSVAAGVSLAGTRGITASRFLVAVRDCSAADTPPPVGLHPLVLIIGGSVGMSIVIGDLVIVVCVSLGTWALCVATARFCQRPGTSRSDVEKWLCFPSCALYIALVLLQGMAFGALDMVLQMSAAAEAVLGTLVVVGLVGGAYGARRARLKVSQDARLKMDHSNHGIRYRFLCGHAEWVDAHLKTGTVPRWGALLRPYTTRGTRMLDLDILATMCFAVLQAAAGRAGTATACGIAKLGMAAVTGVWCAIVFKSRPFRIRRMLVGETIVQLAFAFSIAFAGVGYLAARTTPAAGRRPDVPFGIADGFLMFTACLLLVHACVDAACELYVRLSGRRERMQRENDNFRFGNDLRARHRIVLNDVGGEMPEEAPEQGVVRMQEVPRMPSDVDLGARGSDVEARFLASNKSLEYSLGLPFEEVTSLPDDLSLCRGYPPAAVDGCDDDFECPSDAFGPLAQSEPQTPLLFADPDGSAGPGALLHGGCAYVDYSFMSSHTARAKARKLRLSGKLQTGTGVGVGAPQTGTPQKPNRQRARTLKSGESPFTPEAAFVTGGDLQQQAARTPPNDDHLRCLSTQGSGGVGSPASAPGQLDERDGHGHQRTPDSIALDESGTIPDLHIQSVRSTRTFFSPEKTGSVRARGTRSLRTLQDWELQRELTAGNFMDMDSGSPSSSHSHEQGHLPTGIDDSPTLTTTLARTTATEVSASQPSGSPASVRDRTPQTSPLVPLITALSKFQKARRRVSQRKHSDTQFSVCSYDDFPPASAVTPTEPPPCDLRGRPSAFGRGVIDPIGSTSKLQATPTMTAAPTPPRTPVDMGLRLGSSTRAGARARAASGRRLPSVLGSSEGSGSLTMRSPPLRGRVDGSRQRSLSQRQGESPTLHRERRPSLVGGSIRERSGCVTPPLRARNASVVETVSTSTRRTLTPTTAATSSQRRQVPSPLLAKVMMFETLGEGDPQQQRSPQSPLPPPPQPQDGGHDILMRM